MNSRQTLKPTNVVAGFALLLVAAAASAASPASTPRRDSAIATSTTAAEIASSEGNWVYIFIRDFFHDSNELGPTGNPGSDITPNPAIIIKPHVITPNPAFIVKE